MSLLEAEGLTKIFGNGVRAVDGVDLRVEPGETLGIVGESGCGKSTTAKLLLRLLAADAGRIRFDGVDVTTARGRALRRMRAQLQVVPQHPMTSLNPRLMIGDSVEFNLRAQGVARGVRRQTVGELFERVGLPPAHVRRYPHQLSGGQLQRVAIARALATSPKLVVCDEAVSALDKSVQAQVLNLLVELQRDLGIAYLFISHDLSVVEHISDRVAVMYLGRIVEEGPADELWRDARHPYTKALLSATPSRNRARIVLKGDPPSAVHVPSGCRFRTRCPEAIDACAHADPALTVVADDPDHRAACVHVARAREVTAV